VFPISTPPFTGGIISGTSNGGGSAKVTGSGETMTEETVVTDNVAEAGANGNADFTSTSGSSGFINTVFGSATGSSAGGATGEQIGSVGITDGGVSLASFGGETTSSGAGGFGAGFSPVAFNTVVTEVPGSPIPATFKSSKKGGSSGGGVGPPTFITTVTPVSTGPTGGFGNGNGNLNIAGTTEGTLASISATVPVGKAVGSISGKATNFGGGMASATNFFGTAGGLGSGAGTGAASGSGDTSLALTPITDIGSFTGTGGATGNFDNSGSATFGTPGTLFIPP
jgi:hypothetical protein